MLLAAEAARDPREQIQLLDASPSARPGTRGSRRRGAAAAFCRPSAAAVSATSQSTGFSAPSMRTMGCGDPLGRIHALEAEAVAVGDPGLVDLLVLARHDAHELAAQHVRVEVGAEARRAARPAACCVISQARA